MINSSCPALECLLLVCSRGVGRITIESRNLVSIGVRCGHGELIIEDAPLLRRLIHDIQVDDSVITVVSEPKLETLGQFVFAKVSKFIEVLTFHDTFSCTCSGLCFYLI